MHYKALLNFGEGASIHVENDGETEQVIDGEPMTLEEWLQDNFRNLDRLVLDLGEDSLFYPFAVGELQETVTGDFKRALPAEPYTMLPRTDDSGNIQQWEQRITQDGGSHKTKVFPADEMWSIVINKESARDQTGISEVLRNQDEIEAFMANEEAISQAIELHGFPQRHIKVGREDGTPVSDDDLRRVRTVFDPRTSDANTAYFTGQDVDVETLEAHEFDYAKIHEMDMRNLTTALGLPVEAGNVGSDGLGSGKPAELRMALLKLSLKATQRTFASQFVEEIFRPVVKKYTPYDHTHPMHIHIGDPLEDMQEVADLINKVGGVMTNSEKRDRLDLPEPEDEELAGSYLSPAQQEKQEQQDAGGGIGGLFNEQTDGDADHDKSLADIPDKYTDGTGLTEGDFVPNQDVEDTVGDVLDFIDEHGLVNPDNQREGAARANQLKTHAAENDPLAVDFWREISNFHARHRAQGNHQCDQESLPAKATEMDNNRFDACYYDAGWFSDKTWGGDAGKAQADRIVAAIEETDGVELSLEQSDSQPDIYAHTPEFDAPLLRMQQAAVDPDTDLSRSLTTTITDDATPEFVLQRIRDAVDAGAIFSDFEDIPGGSLFELREDFKEVLGQDDFSLEDVTERVMSEFGVDRDSAQTIARTESSAVLNKAREIGYEQEGDPDAKYYWTGATPPDRRQTDACEWLINKTNPFEGGEPVSLKQLRQDVDEAPTHDDQMDNDLARPDSWVVHPNERSTFVKAPPTT
jgi:hypothetical protein